MDMKRPDSTIFRSWVFSRWRKPQRRHDVPPFYRELMDAMDSNHDGKVTVEGRQEQSTTGDHISLVKGAHSLEVKGGPSVHSLCTVDNLIDYSWKIFI